MKAFIALGVILTPPHRNGGLGGGGRDEEDGGWCKFVEFFQFFFKFVVFFSICSFFFNFLSYEGIYCPGGHFDPPSRNGGLGGGE